MPKQEGDWLMYKVQLFSESIFWNFLTKACNIFKNISIPYYGGITFFDNTCSMRKKS